MAKGQQLGERESQNSDLASYLAEFHQPETEAATQHPGKQGSERLPKHCVNDQESSALPAPGDVIRFEICW